MARFQTAGDLINRAARALFSSSAPDPFASVDPAFIQLCTLATECGQELVQECAWQQLEKTAAFTTAPGDSGLYALPADFSAMIDQTGWQEGAPGAAYPLLGPASGQWWSYLQASQSLNLTIYAWFRIAEGTLQLWPQPPAVGIPIAYKYTSRDWVLNGTAPPGAPTYRDSVVIAADVPLFEPILFLKKLKLAWLTAKGFESTKAQAEFDLALDAWKGKDKSAPVLSLNGPVGFNLRLLNSFNNCPETGFGS